MEACHWSIRANGDHIRGMARIAEESLFSFALALGIPIWHMKGDMARKKQMFFRGTNAWKSMKTGKGLIYYLFSCDVDWKWCWCLPL